LTSLPSGGMLLDSPGNNQPGCCRGRNPIGRPGIHLNDWLDWSYDMGGIIQRHRELRARRHRKKKLKILKRRATKANASEKAIIAGKIRRLTPGAEVIIAGLALEERK
jgi:hypothetical protein